MPARLIAFDNARQISPRALIGDMQLHLTRPGGRSDLLQQPHRGAGPPRVVHDEIAPLRMKLMRHRHHRRDTDAAAHQHRPRRVLCQREMVDRLRDKDPPPLAEDPVHKERAAPAIILAQHRDLVCRPVRRIPRHRVLPQVFRGHHDVEMRARLPRRQIPARDRSEFIFHHPLRRLFRLGNHNLNDRAFAIRRENMHRAVIATLQPGLVFICRDHRLIGLDPGLAVHRERVGVGMRRKRRRVDRKGLIFVFQVQIALQATLIDGMFGRTVAAIFLQLEIPPPFLNRVEPAIANHIVQLGQGGGQLRHIHRRPAKRLFLEDALKVPRAGFHAAPAHRPAFGRHPVGRAFLAVGFPNLVAVKHQLRPGGDRTRGAFTRAFIAGLAKGLQPKINWFVMGQRQVGGHRARLQPWPQIGVQDHLANAADLPQTA